MESNQFLAPYVNLMGLAGLRPASTDTTNLMQYFSHFQTILTALLLGFSYGFQNINNYRYVLIAINFNQIILLCFIPLDEIAVIQSITLRKITITQNNMDIIYYHIDEYMKLENSL